MAKNDNITTAHDFSFVSIDGEDMPLATFAGKAILVVNTASRCGFTRQYDGLQKIWEDYRERNLVVLGVPSNDFGGQEPGVESEIKSFCEINFSIDFPIVLLMIYSALAEFTPLASSSFSSKPRLLDTMKLRSQFS